MSDNTFWISTNCCLLYFNGTTVAEFYIWDIWIVCIVYITGVKCPVPPRGPVPPEGLVPQRHQVPQRHLVPPIGPVPTISKFGETRWINVSPYKLWYSWSLRISARFWRDFGGTSEDPVFDTYVFYIMKGFMEIVLYMFQVISLCRWTESVVLLFFSVLKISRGVLVPGFLTFTNHSLLVFITGHSLLLITVLVQLKWNTMLCYLS